VEVRTGTANTATVVVNYTMKDSQGATSLSTLTLTVNGANDPPVVDLDFDNRARPASTTRLRFTSLKAIADTDLKLTSKHWLKRELKMPSGRRRRTLERSATTTRSWVRRAVRGQRQGRLAPGAGEQRPPACGGDRAAEPACSALGERSGDAERVSTRASSSASLRMSICDRAGVPQVAHAPLKLRSLALHTIR
jgi:hypothetical protein